MIGVAVDDLHIVGRCLSQAGFLRILPMLSRGPYWPPIRPPAFVKTALKKLLYL